MEGKKKEGNVTKKPEGMGVTSENSLIKHDLTGQTEVDKTETEPHKTINHATKKMAMIC